MKQIIIITLLSLTLMVYADEEKDKRNLIYPVVFYSPETSLAFGFTYVKLKPIKALNKSNVNQLFVYYTLKNQYILQSSAERYLLNKNKFEAEFGLKKNKEDFWGIGNNTTEADIEEYTSQEIDANFSFFKEAFANFYLGLKYEWGRYRVVETEANSFLKLNAIRGYKKTHVSGIGTAFSYDTRNSQFFPTKGFNWDFEFIFHQKFWGSEYNFYRCKLDFRNFFPLYENHIFATQLKFMQACENVPFQLLPKLGGSEIMRGFYEGRYRDQKYLASQIEYRFPLYKKFRGNIFSGLGCVNTYFKDFSWNDFKLSYGLGLRYLIVEEQKLYFRTDFGFNGEDMKVYFGATEAF